ncbi:hypothetical protein SprV_0100105900 [Sparganum proliferum]
MPSGKRPPLCGNGHAHYKIFGCRKLKPENSIVFINCIYLGEINNLKRPIGVLLFLLLRVRHWQLAALSRLQ